MDATGNQELTNWGFPQELAGAGCTVAIWDTATYGQKTVYAALGFVKLHGDRDLYEAVKTVFDRPTDTEAGSAIISLQDHQFSCSLEATLTERPSDSTLDARIQEVTLSIIETKSPKPQYPTHGCPIWFTWTAANCPDEVSFPAWDALQKELALQILNKTWKEVTRPGQLRAIHTAVRETKEILDSRSPGGLRYGQVAESLLLSAANEHRTGTVQRHTRSLQEILERAPDSRLGVKVGRLTARTIRRRLVNLDKQLSRSHKEVIAPIMSKLEPQVEASTENPVEGWQAELSRGEITDVINVLMQGANAYADAEDDRDVQMQLLLEKATGIYRAWNLTWDQHDLLTVKFGDQSSESISFASLEDLVEMVVPKLTQSREAKIEQLQSDIEQIRKETDGIYVDKKAMIAFFDRHGWVWDSKKPQEVTSNTSGMTTISEASVEALVQTVLQTRQGPLQTEAERLQQEIKQIEEESAELLELVKANEVPRRDSPQPSPQPDSPPQPAPLAPSRLWPWAVAGVVSIAALAIFLRHYGLQPQKVKCFM